MEGLRRNRHHLWYPASDYEDEIGFEFRELPCNIVMVDVQVHALIHNWGYSPVRPSEITMRSMIHRHTKRTCGCFRGPSAY